MPQPNPLQVMSGGVGLVGTVAVTGLTVKALENVVQEPRRTRKGKAKRISDLL